jgi:hypothetical protein
MPIVAHEACTREFVLQTVCSAKGRRVSYETDHSEALPLSLGLSKSQVGVFFGHVKSLMRLGMLEKNMVAVTPPRLHKNSGRPATVRKVEIIAT